MAYGETLPVVGGSNDIWGTENNNLWNAAPTFTERLQGLAVISPINDQDEYLTYHARFPFDVKRVAFQCLPSGTATLSFKINNVNITGLNSLSATATKQTADATGTNAVVVGNYVTVTPESVSSDVERIVIAIWGDRTDAGTNVT